MSSQSEDFLESLERTHVVLFHDGNEEKKQTEYGFIKKGLDKGQHCFYTTQNRQKIEKYKTVSRTRFIYRSF